ncbi:MAG: DnaJ family domain-containing protein [Thermodesulfobacteriota bacterium]
MMLNGFQKIVEERIRKAQEEGEFDNLPGSGKPLSLDDVNVPEDLRLAYKILKNAECLPPEIELKKEITQIEEVLAGMTDTTEKYRILKKLNFLILKLNLSRGGSVRFEMPQHYEVKLAAHMEANKSSRSK